MERFELYIVHIANIYFIVLYVIKYYAIVLLLHILSLCAYYILLFIITLYVLYHNMCIFSLKPE